MGLLESLLWLTYLLSIRQNGISAGLSRHPTHFLSQSSWDVEWTEPQWQEMDFLLWLCPMVKLFQQKQFTARSEIGSWPKFIWAHLFSRVQHYTGFRSQALHLGPYLLFLTRKDWPSERRKAFPTRKIKPVWIKHKEWRMKKMQRDRTTLKKTISFAIQSKDAIVCKEWTLESALSNWQVQTETLTVTMTKKNTLNKKPTIGFVLNDLCSCQPITHVYSVSVSSHMVVLCWHWRETYDIAGNVTIPFVWAAV